MKNFDSDTKEKNTNFIKANYDHIGLNDLKKFSKGEIEKVEQIISKLSEYKFILQKATSQYTRIKFIQTKTKLKNYFLISMILLSSYEVIKYYYVIYYYIKWDVDIRKPRVSDYIIERFR
jgi:hypothetical protein